MKLAVTGPRKLNAKSSRWARFQLRTWLNLNIIEYGVENLTAFSGMALGTDTIWAQEVLLAGVPLTAYIPLACQHGWMRGGRTGIWMQIHDRAWSREDRDEFEGLLFMANSVVDCSDSFPGETQRPELMLKWRSKCMANDCDQMGAVWHEIKKGGTYSCLQYTMAMEKPVWGMNLKSRTAGMNLWGPEDLDLQ